MMTDKKQQQQSNITNKKVDKRNAKINNNKQINTCNGKYKTNKNQRTMKNNLNKYSGKQKTKQNNFSEGYTLIFTDHLLKKNIKNKLVPNLQTPVTVSNNQLLKR